MWSWLALAVAMWLWLALAVSIVVVRPLRKAQDSLPRLYWIPADDGVTGRFVQNPETRFWAWRWTTRNRRSRRCGPNLI